MPDNEFTVHPSSIDSFLTCGEQHRLRYLEGIRSTVSWDLLIGRAFHFVVHSDAVRFKNDGKFMDHRLLLEEARQALKMELDNENGYIEGPGCVEIDYIGALEYCQELVGRYVADIREREDYRPTDTEVAMDAKWEFPNIFERVEVDRSTGQEFIVKESGVLKISGRMDIITGPAHFWEFKSKKKSGKIPKSFAGETSLQSNIYLMLLEQITGKPATGHFAFVKSSEAKVFEVKLEDWKRERTNAILENVLKAKKAGIYIPAAQDASRNWACSYCGVRSSCRYTLHRG